MGVFGAVATSMPRSCSDLGLKMRLHVWQLALAVSLFNILTSQAQSVYAVNAYAGVATCEHQWLIGTRPLQFGFTQFSRWEDAGGLTIMSLDHQNEEFGKHCRYTRLQLAEHSFDLPGPAWVVIPLLILGGLLFVFLFLLAVNRAVRRQANDPPDVSAAASSAANLR